MAKKSTAMKAIQAIITVLLAVAVVLMAAKAAY